MNVEDVGGVEDVRDAEDVGGGDGEARVGEGRTCPAAPSPAAPCRHRGALAPGPDLRVPRPFAFLSLFIDFLRFFEDEGYVFRVMAEHLRQVKAGLRRY